MSNTFFEPLPSDMQCSVLRHLSSTELLQRCFVLNKPLRVYVVLTLLSRRDSESLDHQKKFLAAWCNNPEHFTWIRGHESAMTAVLDVLINDTVVECDIRMSAMSVLACMQNLLSAPSKLDAKIAEARLSPVRPKLHSESSIDFLQACRTITAIADRLPIMAIQTLLPTIIARFEDEDNYVRSAAGEAFVALFKRLAPEQQEPYLRQISALLEHNDWPVREQACRSLANMVDRLSTEILQSLLPKIIARLEDEHGAVLSHTHKAFFALFKRLPQDQQRLYLPQLSALLNHQYWGARKQACQSLANTADRLSTETIQTLMPKIVARLEDKDNDVQRAAGKAFIAFFKRLAPEQQELHLSQMSALLVHKDWRVRAQACESLANMADRLSIQTLQTLLPKIIALYEDYYKDVRCAAGQAFVVFFRRLPPEQQGLHLSQIIALLVHKDWRFSEQACQSLTGIAAHLPTNTIQSLLPKIIARFDDKDNNDIQGAAHETFFAFFKRLPSDQQEPYLREISDLFGRKRRKYWRIRLQVCEGLAEITDHLPTKTVQTLLPKIITLFDAKYDEVKGAAGQVFFALFKKMPEEQHGPYLKRIIALLGHKNCRVRKQACHNLAEIAGRLSIETIQTLLPVIVARFEDEEISVRNMAYYTISALLRRLLPEQREPYIAQIMLLIQEETASYRPLSLLVDILSVQHLQPLLLDLLAALENNERRTDACLTLKHYLSKLPKTSEDRATRLWMCDLLRLLLTSPDESIRKAALGIATFPGMLALWRSDNMPEADYLECLYLQNMCKLNTLLAAAKQASPEEALGAMTLSP